MLDGFPVQEKLPANPALRSTIEQIEATNWAAEIYDAQWRLVWVSQEMRHFLNDDYISGKELGYGRHMLEVYSLEPWKEILTDKSFKSAILKTIPYVAFDTPQPLEAVPGDIASSLELAIQDIEPQQPPPFYSTEIELLKDNLPPVKVTCIHTRIYDAEDNFVGTAKIYGPALPSSLLNLVARGNQGMFERMSRLVNPGPQRVSILFADLQGSTRLSRKLPRTVYFRLISSITKAIDDIIIAGDGIVGKHSGDGVSAFFLAEDHNDSISAAIRESIIAARKIREQVEEIGQQITKEFSLPEEIDCQIKIGLHWSSTVYMGQIVSGGRLEVTALGDEVNDCARIEQTARGGEILASKMLLERLNSADAKQLDIYLSRIIYDILFDLESNDSKVIRDRINIPVARL